MRSYAFYDWLSRDFFKYLSELPEQNEYAAPGSRQRVRVKNKFQRKAKKAYKLCLEAIESEGKANVNVNVNDKWKKIYGRPFPAAEQVSQEALTANFSDSWANTEEFIEDKFLTDIRYQLKIDCEVMQRGFRKFRLREILGLKIPLKSDKRLKFWVTEF